MLQVPLNVYVISSLNRILSIAFRNYFLYHLFGYVAVCDFLIFYLFIFFTCILTASLSMLQMLSSLKKIMALPDDTNIYCGHEYTLVSQLVFPDFVYR